MKQLICLYCQKSFQPNPDAKRPQTYCTYVCARAAYNELRRDTQAANRPANFVCNFCQKTCVMPPGCKHLRYCSDECARKSRYWKNRPAEITRMKAWREANPELYKQIRQRYYKENKTKVNLAAKNWQLKRDHGMSLVEYDAACETRQNKCDICGGTCLNRTLRIDHDHSTQARRGMLCDSCNLGIGKLKDSSKILQAAADYLRSFGC